MLGIIWDFLDVAGERAADVTAELKKFFERDWTVAEKVLVILCYVLFGVVKGQRYAKRRNIAIGSNNGNGNGDIYEAPCEFEEE